MKTIVTFLAFLPLFLVAQIRIPITNNMIINSNSNIKFIPGDYVFADPELNGVIQISGKQNITLDGDSCTVNGTNSLQIRPNPSDGNAWITYHLQESGNILLEMIDTQGTQVSTLASGYRQPGDYSIPVSKGFLPSGIYIIRLTTLAGTEARRLVVVK